jgi:hypothetical protein
MTRKLLAIAFFAAAMASAHVAPARTICDAQPSYCLPDLAPQPLVACSVLSNLSPTGEPNGTVSTYLALKVDNRGLAQSPASQVWVVCNKTVSHSSTSVISGFSTGTAYFRISGDLRGRVCTAIVDPLGLIAESNKSNNSVGIFCPSS